ncbi:MAG: hypothetical protein IE909_09640 [Campylobacterales bacterium]|nr:hypothetical protein [Campylobacterota bacterium]MBD3842130.1 hypothetical protein [Campylobacterales bacterium]
MKGKILVTTAVAGALFSGCALPKPPSAFPDVPEVQKGEISKYKTIDFEEFMASLPINYTTDRTREIPIECNNIKPEHPKMCHPFMAPMLGDFFRGLKREAERYCIAKNGYLVNRKDEMIKKYLAKNEVEKAAKLKAAKGWDGYSCKIDGKDYFGYVSNGAYIQFYTPKYFQSVFDVFTAEPILEFAKEKGWNIKEYPKYYEISGENAEELIRGYEPYIEEDSCDLSFKRDFTRDVLFNTYHITDDELYEKVQELIKKAEAIVEKRVNEDYQNFVDLDVTDVLDIKIEGNFWIKIPLKASTKNGKVLIFKPKEWQPTFKKIMDDVTPLLKEYYRLVKESTSSFVPDSEMFNY